MNLQALLRVAAVLGAGVTEPPPRQDASIDHRTWRTNQYATPQSKSGAWMKANRKKPKTPADEETLMRAEEKRERRRHARRKE